MTGVQTVSGSLSPRLMLSFHVPPTECKSEKPDTAACAPLCSQVCCNWFYGKIIRKTDYIESCKTTKKDDTVTSFFPMQNSYLLHIEHRITCMLNRQQCIFHY